ncbi:hypothetical protein SAMN05660443_1350 [Marinospirillum celere]|uniref:Uncharacterized protein n=1 Tax=Marinospirillum celere TaxID=1122252 RepID=A0A1I1G1Z2_9GAMM|nr:hypothetical protein [Marinospirillum celere]SFC05555.1 hypothetical protein SAMN05660443_1350 [Marinospirillum celere]
MSEQKSGYKPTFTSSGSALRTLRVGKSNPNWQAAAEFLLERAAPDVRLLVEAAAEIERDKVELKTEKRQVPGKRKSKIIYNLSWLQWVALGFGGVVLISLLVWIVQNATLRAC